MDEATASGCKWHDSCCGCTVDASVRRWVPPAAHPLCKYFIWEGGRGSTGKGAGRRPKAGEARPTGAGAQARAVAPSCWGPLGEGRRRLQSEVGLLQLRGTGALPHWLRRALLRVTGACGRNRSAEDTWPGRGACWPNCLSVRESVSESVCLLGHGCSCQGRGAPPAQLTQPHPSPGTVEMTGPWWADGHGAGRPAGRRTPPANGRQNRGWREVETRSLQGSSPRGCLRRRLFSSGPGAGKPPENLQRGRYSLIIL